MSAHGIPLKEILGSVLVMEQVRVKGVDGLKRLADEQAARVTKEREKPTAIHILHKVGDTSIDIALSNVTEMQGALIAIGYTKKGLLNRIKDWWWMA
jgi:hypothetical protein